MIKMKLPLTALLSHVLVALTIEIDNEVERRAPHRTTRQGPSERTGPWLVSTVMYFNCMHHVDDAGITAKDLERQARTKTNLHGMQRWGYITLGEDGKVYPTAAGRKAREIWEKLFPIVEGTWQDRYGEARIAALRQALIALIDSLRLDMPDCLPILGYGLVSSAATVSKRVTQDAAIAELPLVALLSKTLLAIAFEFERDSDVSLAIAANVLRLVDDQGVAVREIPPQAGISKEAVSTALSFLEKQGYVTIETAMKGTKRTKRAMLTRKGSLSRDVAVQRIGDLEVRWRKRFGAETIDALRAALEQLADPSEASLLLALDAPPECWRASVPKTTHLPHFPVVLHRGGYPDGS